MIAFLLASCLEQVPLVDEPELTIWRFTRTLANEYYDGNDLFSDIWGVMKIETPKGAYLIAADPLWHRVLYSREGDKGNIYAFGTGTLLEPYDIAGKFPNIFITDQLKGMVAQYEMVDSADGYSFRLKRWIGGATGTEPHLNWPKGIAYSDNGTPGALSDDYIYVVDIKLGKIFKFRVSDGEFASSKIAPVSLIHPIDIAIGKEVFGNQVRNTDSLYVLDQMNFRIACLRDGDSSYFYEIKFRPITYLRSIDTDPCGRILVSTSYESIHIFEILSLSPFMVDTCVFPGPPFNKIHDVYVSGNEVIVSERWTDNTGISLYRITDECAPECCKPIADITWPRRDGQLIIADSVPIKGLAKCKGIGTGCEGYDYLKYWALYIAEGWNPPAEDFAFLAGAPGATDGEDTLCWLRADTFEPGNYTILLRGVSNDPDELPGEDRVKISIRHGLPTDPTIVYLRRPDGTWWYPTMEIAPMASPVEVGWRIVGPAGKLRFRLSTNNGVSYQDISGWLPPGTLIDDSTYEGSWVWNTPNFPSRKVKLLMEVYDTAGEYSSSCEIAPAIVVVSDVGGITAGNGGRKLALSEDGVLHGVWATGKIIRDTMNPGPEDIQSSVYYSYSTDLGMSWAPPKLVARGRDPSIALFDNGSAGMVYLSDKADTLYYRPINKAGNPGKPTVLNVGARLYGSPAITVRGGRAYVVAETYDSLSACLVMWELRKQGQLVQTAEMVGPWQETPANPLEMVAVPIGGKREATDTVYYVLMNPQGSPSATTDITGRLHLAWDKGSEIWYGRETDTGWVFAQVSDSGVLASDPCLDVHGGNAYITWEEHRRVLVRKYGFVEGEFWSPRADTVAKIIYTPGWFRYPVVDKGGAVSWTTAIPGPFFMGVNLIQYKTDKGGWEELSTSISDPPLGDHPQLEIARENLTAAWSQGYWEMNPLWSRPMGRFYLGTELLNQDQPPFWWVELGDSEATPYTVHRGGFTVYSSGVRADVDSAYLAYKFPLFGPSESEIWLKLYYEGNDDWRGVSVRVNDQDFGNFWYPKGEAIWARCEPGLAESLSVILSNIGGSEVSIAGIYVYATGAGKMEATAIGGNISGLPLVLSLNAPYPNPAKGRVTISYAIPGQYEGQALSLRVYDVSGRRRQSLAEGRAEAGVFTIPFTGEGLPGGFYFIVLRVGEEQRVQKLAWVR